MSEFRNEVVFGLFPVAFAVLFFCITFGLDIYHFFWCKCECDASGSCSCPSHQKEIKVALLFKVFPTMQSLFYAVAQILMLSDMLMIETQRDGDTGGAAGDGGSVPIQITFAFLYTVGHFCFYVGIILRLYFAFLNSNLRVRMCTLRVLLVLCGLAFVAYCIGWYDYVAAGALSPALVTSSAYTLALIFVVIIFTIFYMFNRKLFLLMVQIESTRAPEFSVTRTQTEMQTQTHTETETETQMTRAHTDTYTQTETGTGTESAMDIGYRDTADNRRVMSVSSGAGSASAANQTTLNMEQLELIAVISKQTVLFNVVIVVLFAFMIVVSTLYPAIDGSALWITNIHRFLVGVFRASEVCALHLGFAQYEYIYQRVCMCGHAGCMQICRSMAERKVKRQRAAMTAEMNMDELSSGVELEVANA